MAMNNGAQEKNELWLRECSLVVGDDSGNGLDLSKLRIKFSTQKGDVETPNSAEIIVYNLSEDTRNKIEKEFTQVVLQAGYKGNMGIIFKGNIRQVRRSRENGTDTLVEITAADGDRAYSYATVNKTLAAGSTPADEVAVCQESFAQKGTGAGHVPELGGQPLPRAKVMYGPARSYMRDVADTTHTTWSIQDGKMQMVKKNSYLPGEAVVLTHETGLVGTPEQTNEGIKLRCLLNPRLRIGGRIKLDNKSIQRAKTDLKMSATRPPRLADDGFYRILKVEFSGDTRGNDWYAEMVCVGLDDTSKLPLDLVN